MKVLCIDIGGTLIKYARMGPDATILSRDTLPTPQSGREALVDALSGIYAANSDADGIAISMPGIIDAENGYCVTGGALRYNEGFPLRQALRERCPVPICIENDAKCAALAEAAFGSLKDVSDGLVLLFGTMIGCGIIRDHHLVRGRHHSAGEVSFIIPRPDKSPGFDNMWGNVCGIPRLCRAYAGKKGLDLDKVDGKTIFRMVHAGDRDAITVLDDFTRDIAVQIFNLQTVLDPERVAIGGGISAQPVLIEYIQRNLDTLYKECPYIVPHAEVVPCRFGNDANLIGALQCFLERNTIL